MMYSWRAKNAGKDLVYQKRVELVRKLGLKVSTPRMYAYIMEAELGVILH